jgi:hypothetical protein
VLAPVLQVTKGDVNAALSVMNFAIYHKELTDMDEREAEREKEAERKRAAERDARDDESDDDADPQASGTRFSISLLFSEALRRLNWIDNRTNCLVCLLCLQLLFPCRMATRRQRRRSSIGTPKKKGDDVDEDHAGPPFGAPDMAAGSAAIGHLSTRSTLFCIFPFLIVNLGVILQ